MRDTYPDKRPTQRVGIIPDLVARPTIEEIRAGRDEVLALIEHAHDTGFTRHHSMTTPSGGIA